MPEAVVDLADTNADIADLSAIVNHMRAYICEPRGEQRISMRIELLKWERHLAEAHALKVKIEQHIAALSLPTREQEQGEK